MPEKSVLEATPEDIRTSTSGLKPAKVSFCFDELETGFRELTMRDGVAIRKLEKSCEDVSQILRALGHPQRLMVMAHLSDGEKNVSELVELCDVSQSQLSQFLGRMKAEGLVDSRREGAYQYYFIEDKRVAKLIKTLADLFCK